MFVFIFQWWVVGSSVDPNGDSGGPSPWYGGSIPGCSGETWEASFLQHNTQLPPPAIPINPPLSHPLPKIYTLFSFVVDCLISESQLVGDRLIEGLHFLVVGLNLKDFSLALVVAFNCSLS